MLIPQNPEERKKTILELIGGGILHHLNLDEAQLLQLEDINQPLQLRLRITALNQLDKVSKFYIMPMPLTFSMPTVKALFSHKRHNDLDLNMVMELSPATERATLQLTRRMSLLELPENINIDNDFGKYSLIYEQKATNCLSIANSPSRGAL